MQGVCAPGSPSWLLFCGMTFSILGKHLPQLWCAVALSQTSSWNVGFMQSFVTCVFCASGETGQHWFKFVSFMWMISSHLPYLREVLR